jgi:hypothetical protein
MGRLPARELTNSSRRGRDRHGADKGVSMRLSYALSIGWPGGGRPALAGRVHHHLRPDRRHDTLPIYIYTQVKFGITPEVNAVAAMLLAASLAILGLAFALPQLLRLGQRAVRSSAGASYTEHKRLPYPSRAPRSVASIPPNAES